MPIDTLHPTAVGSQDQWTLGAGADKVVAVASNDGDTTYIQAATGTGFQQKYAMPNIPTAATVNSCTCSVVARHLGVDASLNNWDGNAYQPQTMAGTYATYSNAFGLALTPANVNAAESGVQHNGGTSSIAVTEIYWTVNYTVYAGFIFLLQLAGLSAFPFIGRMDLQQFQRYLSWRRCYHPRHTILTPAEVRQAWRELCEYRHPHYV